MRLSDIEQLRLCNIITKEEVAEATGNSVTTLLDEVTAKRFSRGMEYKVNAVSLFKLM
jgi:hypothetical protein